MTSLVISGVACRFPGADDKNGYWARICAAENAVSALPSNRWRAQEWFANAGDATFFQKVPGGYIKELEGFDYQHFSLNHREASLMDPQQRWLLQTAWQALEDAGYSPAALRGKKVGVFVGAMTNDWATLQFRDADALLPAHVTGNGHALLSNRISYLFDFKGPSMTFDTACSSSAVAFVQAAKAMEAGECELAIVAGVNAILTPVLQRFYQKAGLLSQSQRCNAFSDHADGIIRSEGVGAVILENKQTAKHQYCGFVAGHINHDGQSNGLTAPNGPSQEALIAACYRKAGLDAADIDFIECHGTGTALGDRIEIGALNRIFRGTRNQPCQIDSVKSLIGHCESAAAMASIIKVALMLKKREIPQNPFAETPNAMLQKGNLSLSAAHQNWLADNKKHFAVSSFGLGGTNAHLVFVSPEHDDETVSPAMTFIPVSAADDAGFERQKAALINTISQGADAQALANGHQAMRQQGEVRDFRFGANAQELEESALLLGEPPYTGGIKRGCGAVVFLFTGQGCQYPGMLKGLLNTFPQFRDYFTQCDAVFQRLTGESLLPVVDSDAAAQTLLGQGKFAQPVLFAAEWALARWWMDVGITPDAVIGHSIGEFAAATIAGVMTMEEAMSLVAARGEAIDAVSGCGTMAAVLAEKAVVEQLQTEIEGLSIAVWNSNQQFVIAGSADAIEKARIWGMSRHVRVKPLTVTHAFHSPQMNPAAADIETVAKTVNYCAPALPWYSTLSGKLQPNRRIDANYWVEHLVKAVQFKPALDALVQDLSSDAGLVGVEMGPAPVLSMLALKQGYADAEFFSTSMEDSQDTNTFCESLRALFRRGYDINWPALNAGGSEFDLAPYAFNLTDFSRFPFTEEAPTSVTKQPTANPEPVDEALSSQTVAETVVEVLSLVTGHPEEAITQGKKLSSELGLDSVNLIELVDKLRARLGEAAMPQMSQLFDVETVSDLTVALERAAVNQE